MKKEARCFITNASYKTPDTYTTCPVFELSEFSRTFSKRKTYHTLEGDDRNLITSFHYDGIVDLTKADVKVILSVTQGFTDYLTGVVIKDKPTMIAGFFNWYNNQTANEVKLINFNYNSTIDYNYRNFPDFFIFETAELLCSVWVSDDAFKLSYTLYDIDVVDPFENFANIVRVPSEMFKALAKANTDNLMVRCDDAKDGQSSTYTRSLNVPYRESKNSKEVDCYFGFNIYGEAGNHEYIWRDHLYDHLKDMGLDDEFIEEHFPSIFKVNEFFIIPDWQNYAIPYDVGQGSLNSHVTLSWNAEYNLCKFFKVYEDMDYMIANTYDVPIAYNNLLLRVINGKYTAEPFRDFKKYYSDLLTVASNNTSYSVMETHTQRFVDMLGYMMVIAESSSQADLFARLLSYSGIFKFRLSKRKEVFYVVTRYENITYYVIPRYEYERLNV